MIMPKDPEKYSLRTSIIGYGRSPSLIFHFSFFIFHFINCFKIRPGADIHINDLDKG